MSKQDFNELKKIIEINSWTKNKEGVDQNGEIFAYWMQELGFTLTRYPREDIGDHLHLISSHREGKNYSF